MKTSSLITLALFLSAFSVTPAVAQDTPIESATRPRTVMAPSAQNPVEAPKVVAAPVVTEAARTAPSTATTEVRTTEENPSARAALVLSANQVRTRISEAERMLKSQPKQTALASPSIQFVTLAALERTTGRIHLINLSKEIFLKRDSEVTLPTSLGTLVSVRVLRANGVNTAVTVQDNAGQSLVPLVVEFPIEKRGVFKEMAYYTSAHPALLSRDLTNAGRAYVRSMLDLAAKRVREKGIVVSPQLIDIAERLCLVEHVDHQRFKNENRLALYDEIFSLYALNELDTYRYAVSTAGAGGMVQMIPWAYNLVRQRHPGVGLTPDFVVGMRTHSNALQAMLLYMHDTWNDLAANSEVQYALSSKLATQEELMAAGYNSNAAKLPGYLRRGGSGWRTLIPRETQMYLQIYKSVDGLVPMRRRTEADLQATN
jgi:hypothetical protein